MPRTSARSCGTTRSTSIGSRPSSCRPSCSNKPQYRPSDHRDRHLVDDRAAIIAVLNPYADACDSRDWALFERVFTPDVTSDYGPGYERADRAAIIASIQSHLGGLVPTPHLPGHYHIR